MPQNNKAIFLIACGCAIATSTMVSEILKEEIVRQKKYKVKLTCPPKSDPSRMLQIRQKETENAKEATIFH